MDKDPVTTGKELPEPGFVDKLRELKDAKKGDSTLTKLEGKALAKFVRKRWDRLEDVQRQRLAELKVNFLRYSGHSFVQVHPSDANRVFIPPGSTAKKAPTINKIRRTVHRYVAQITADEPVMEGMPASHADDARDAAEAATLALRGEWQRMALTTALQRTMHFASIMRSGFWFLKWDPDTGEKAPAMKFFPNDLGEDVLLPVDANGKQVDDVDDAAKISQGNMRVDVMTPANVRWEGARYAQDAKEVIVGEVINIRALYDSFPETRKIKLSEILGQYEPPVNGSAWLQDLRAESPRGTTRSNSDEFLDKVGEDLNDNDNIMDEEVLVIHYFRKIDRTHKKGFHCVVVGDYPIHTATLRYGKIPVIQFKLIDEVGDPLGLSLVDLLREPQELLDFVNGQILRYLQMMKRRWFVPMHSGVKSRDLMSPTRSIIEYNPQAGKPEPEIQPEIPNSMIQFVERFDAEYDDQSGIHDTLQGKHVPGVSSGRHAEALRSGDETLLGLSRTQIKYSLEYAAEVMLTMMQKEWKSERRVRFFGEDKEYVDCAFRSTDFGSTAKVILKNSTLLMLTPAQRLDTIMSLAEAGALGADEIRKLAPLGDVMGISVSEDVHYQRARRQNNRFLEGPPKKLVAARKEYELQLKAAQSREDTLNSRAAMGSANPMLGMDPEALKFAVDAIEDQKAVAELAWTEMLDKHNWDHRSWEDRKDIARIHAEVHSDALAKGKVERFPEWWVQAFEDHAHMEYELGFPELVMEAAQVQQMMAPPPPQEPPIDATNVETSPAGMSFGPGTPDVVTGGDAGYAR
jgi:hypothetical protein